MFFGLAGSSSRALGTILGFVRPSASAMCRYRRKRRECFRSVHVLAKHLSPIFETFQSRSRVGDAGFSFLDPQARCE